MIKCTRCGADVEAQRFCIYCGERLQAREMSVSRVSRAPSGVMRLRQRASYSQSALPLPQEATAGKTKMQLASLSSARTAVSRGSQGQDSIGGQAMTEQRGRHQRQGNELEALLEKLNGTPEHEQDTGRVAKSKKSPVDSDQYEEAMASLDISLGDMMSDSYSRSLDDSFFLSDEFGEDEDAAGPVPMGSGSFSRVPSGGFKLLFESVKSQCSTLCSKGMTWAKKTTQRDERVIQGSKGGVTWISNRRKQYISIGIAVAMVLFFIGGLALIDGDKSSPELAAQPNPSVEKNNFELIALDQSHDDISDLTFDADDFSIPVLDMAQIGDEEDDVEAQALGLAQVAVAKPAVAKNDATKPQSLKELRLYGRNDNVLVDESGKKTIKLSRDCVMREGPASRFNFVSELKRGNDIDVLTTTDEDWTLETNGLWTKAGQSPKLGPGTQFADGSKGMSLPQPKSRVISAKNWRYVRSNKNYGYVGPACFK